MEVFKRDDPSTVFTIDEIAVRILGQPRPGPKTKPCAQDQGSVTAKPPN
jgi:hypothetical protein